MAPSGSAKKRIENLGRWLRPIAKSKMGPLSEFRKTSSLAQILGASRCVMKGTSEPSSVCPPAIQAAGREELRPLIFIGCEVVYAIWY